MTKASYIHGPIAPNARAITTFVPNIDYTRMTDGELSVKLVARQLDLHYLSTGDKAYKLESESLNSMVDSRMSGRDIYTETALSKWAINKLNKRDFPAIAANALKKTRFKIGNLVQFGDYQDDRAKQCQEIYARWQKTSFLSFRRRRELLEEFNGCLESIKYLNVVNEQLESSAAHIMYTFAGSLRTPQISTKKIMHDVTVDNYSSLFGLSRENILLWLRNGIISQQVDKGTGFNQPKEVIDFMIENVSENYDQIGSRVGVLPIVATIKTILGIVAAALTATQAILSAIPAQDVVRATANTYGLGNSSFGPQKEDFLTEATNTGAIWPWAAAVAIFLISK